MRFYLFSLGCKVNGYESNALREQLALASYEETNRPEEANVIVINTCGVTHVADQKSRQHIRKFRRLNEKAKLIIMGCYSEEHALDVAKMGADIVVGTSERNKIIPYLNDLLSGAKKAPIVDVKKGDRKRVYEEMGPLALSSQARAYLKIQDGCDNFCSYCLIPTLRGNSRSRAKESVLKESANLVKQGYKEIVITGIHIGKYGLDLKEKCDLFDLTENILKENPSLYRLRLGSLESAEITTKLNELLLTYPSLASHIHIPLQSGSSSVLKRMHRPYDTSSFLSTISSLRSSQSDIAITTDIIVGFPGESEEEWQETLDFVKKARFSLIHVFPFSARKGTLAASMDNQISPEVKSRRVHELLALSKELKDNYESSFFGKEVEVLFEESKDGYSYGHTSNYLHVKYPSSVSLRGEVRKIVYREEYRAD